MTIKFTKPKKIFSYKKNEWSKSHVSLPVPFYDGVNNVVRIFYSSMNEKMQSKVSYFEVDPDNLQKTLYICDKPIFDIGGNGDFDDNGVVCTDIRKIGDYYFMLYAGFEICTKIRYRIMTGLAISEDGINFKRTSRTPILDRCVGQEFFRCGPSFYSDNEILYVGGGNWFQHAEKERPIYDIYLSSKVDTNWSNGKLIKRHNIKNDEHGFGRPVFMKVDGINLLSYSVRSITNESYLIRLDIVDEDFKTIESINCEDLQQGTREESLSYSTLTKIKDKLFIFFNGSNFGENDIYASKININIQK